MHLKIAYFKQIHKKGKEIRLIYIVNYCDQWKGYDSMSLAMATTSIRKVIAFIKQGIESDDFYIDEGAEEIYKSALVNKNIDELNNALKYCYIEITADGEKI